MKGVAGVIGTRRLSGQWRRRSTIGNILQDRGNKKCHLDYPE